MRYRVLPYRQGSKSAKALATALGGRVLRLEGSTFAPRSNDVIINWGNTTFNESAEWGPATPDAFYNFDTDIIRHVSNKKLFFETMVDNGHADLIPRFWTNREEIPDDAFPIVCRTVLAGHSGDGIVIAGSRPDLVHAPLYVQYVKKKDEYRIHVGIRPQHVPSHGDVVGDPLVVPQPSIIARQRKARRHDIDPADVNWQIRNHHTGFIYRREGIVTPLRVEEAACHALAASGLDFGAVDVLWNQEKQRAYVLEINTAPGLEGTTVEDYATFFRLLS
jgi:hypothetical protein